MDIDVRQVYIRDTHVMLTLSKRISYVHVGLFRSGAMLFRISRHTDVLLSDVTRIFRLVEFAALLGSQKVSFILQPNNPAFFWGYAAGL